MMASDSDKFTLWFLTCLLFVSLAFSSAQTEGKVSLRAAKGLKDRSRRQTVCDHGTYEHEGKTCCRCGPGTRVASHCSADQNDGRCQSCDPGTYSTDATAETTCEPCTSCEHANANLEEELSCTRARNSKCRCKKDYYCTSFLERCRRCSLCKVCGSEGIRVSCTANNNTVCNDIHEGVNGGIIAGIVISLLIVLSILAAVVYYYRKRQSGSRRLTSDQTNEIAADVDDQEMHPLKALQSCQLPDIAAALGWKDMQDVAIRSGMTQVDIDNCKRNDSGDPEEQTLKLLMKWSEREGRAGGARLIETLQNAKKKEKVEKVRAILRAE